MKILNLFSVLLFVAVLASCGKKTEKSAKSLSVRIDTVRVADADANLQFPGRVVAAEEVSVSFKVSGTISRVYVKEGDRVKAGQLVAEMNPTDYKVQLSATEAEYANIKAEAERVMGLYKDGATTESNNDKARYGLQQIEAKLKNHRDQVAYCKIYAPFSGYVQHKFFEGGENIAAGMPVVSIISGAAPEIEINLPASSYLHRNEFTGYHATFDVLPGETVPLQFISVLAKANTNQLYRMRLKIASPNRDIAPGMSAWVAIETSDSTHLSLRIPTTAIVEADSKAYVFKYTPKTHVVKRVDVSVQKLHTDGTAVVLGNLQPGDMVVSTGAHHLTDGNTVTPLGRISSTNVGGLL